MLVLVLVLAALGHSIDDEGRPISSGHGNDIAYTSWGYEFTPCNIIYPTFSNLQYQIPNRVLPFVHTSHADATLLSTGATRQRGRYHETSAPKNPNKEAGRPRTFSSIVPVSAARSPRRTNTPDPCTFITDTQHPEANKRVSRAAISRVKSDRTIAA